MPRKHVIGVKKEEAAVHQEEPINWYKYMVNPVAGQEYYDNDDDIYPDSGE